MHLVFQDVLGVAGAAQTDYNIVSIFYIYNIFYHSPGHGKKGNFISRKKINLEFH